ncbi:MAG: chemotaxis protein CheD [Polyangia bacterium]
MRLADSRETGGLATQKAPAAGAPDDRPTVYLHPGHMHVAFGQYAVKTVLGSCIAVCVWDDRAQAGGVVHYLLPEGRAVEGNTGKYGSLAIPALIKAVRALGGGESKLRAKVFGGAGVLPSLGKRLNDLGESNARMAWKMLAADNVPVVAKDVGGTRGRRLIFNVDDGSAWVWRL